MLFIVGFICFRAESVYEDETIRPPISLSDIDLGVLFSNMTRKQHLDDVRTKKSCNFIIYLLPYFVYYLAFLAFNI